MNKFYLFFILLFVQCTSQTTEVTFEYNQLGHIIVPITINGKVIKGMFDTGAMGSNIQISQFQKANLRLSKDSVSIWFSYLYNDIHLVPSTQPEIFFINNLKANQDITFTITPDTIGFTIWGNDIIDQFFWLFDFHKKIVKISKKSMNLDTEMWYKLKYKNIENLKLCSIILNDQVQFNNIMIDTGRTYWCPDSTYDAILTLQGQLKDIELVLNNFQNPNDSTTYIKERNYTIYWYDTLKVADNYFYNCYIGLAHQKKNGIEGLQGDMPVNFFKQFEKVYIDTQDNVIYLKK